MGASTKNQQLSGKEVIPLADPLNQCFSLWPRLANILPQTCFSLPCELEEFDLWRGPVATVYFQGQRSAGLDPNSTFI